jgi:hypothetical protein
MEIKTEESPLHKLEKDELEKILRNHELWLKSEETQGKQADLSWVDLTGMILRNVNLKRAILRGTRFEGVKEFTDVNLGGANLQGATLPGNFKKFETLSNVEEASKNARALLVWIIFGCLYSWIAIGMTTDTVRAILRIRASSDQRSLCRKITSALRICSCQSTKKSQSRSKAWMGCNR